MERHIIEFNGMSVNLSTFRYILSKRYNYFYLSRSEMRTKSPLKVLYNTLYFAKLFAKDIRQWCREHQQNQHAHKESDVYIIPLTALCP